MSSAPVPPTARPRPGRWRALAAALALAATARAGGLVLVVNETADLPDAAGDAICDADLSKPGQQITLRAAVMFANAQPGPDQIVLPAGVFKLTLAGMGDASLGDLDVSDDLLVTGVAADPSTGKGGTILDASKVKDRVFDVLGTAVLELQGLTLRKGRAPDGQDGGLIRVSGSLALEQVVLRNGRSGEAGGAVHLQPSADGLVARDVLFLRNIADGDGGALSLEGGVATIERVTFQRNASKAEGGALRAEGVLVNLSNCTLNRNTAKQRGGAIHLEDAAVLSAVNCTLAANAGGGATGIAVEQTDLSASSALLRNTLLDNKGKRNGEGPIISLGGNVDSGSTCQFGNMDLSDTKPLLLKLKPQGGFTPTQALKPGSPAIDMGVDAGCPPTDQRGEQRVKVPDAAGLSQCDCGAYEYVPEGSVQG